MANEFNEFFTTVGARPTETVKSLANENGIFLVSPTNSGTFFGDEFSFHAVSTFE
jgi:ribosomal protein S16